MENYYNSYPESGGSSPRSREIEFENPTPWEDQQSPNYKVKFMCSYGGKIHPRPHDNQLSYVGGETKILSVDRNIKFPALVSKLSTLCDVDVSFKYQLPGEDLDALISVTNDDDLEHMMHEYDRLYRASAKPARLRLFLFAVNPTPLTPSQSFDSTDGKLERERFVESLNTAPAQSSPAQVNNADLFGLDKELPPQPAKVFSNPIPSIQKHIQDLQSLRIGEEQAMYKRQSDDNLNVPFSADYYAQKPPEKLIPTNIPVSSGFWPEKQIAGGVYPVTEQPVYMMPGPPGVYHAPMGRPMPGPAGQGYYAMQRMQPEVYREQPVYSVAPPPKPAVAPPPKAAYSEGFGMVRPVTTGVMMDTGYPQMAYDSAMARQVYYNAPGGVVPPQYQAMPPYTADMKSAGVFSQENTKAVPPKVSRAL